MRVPSFVVGKGLVYILILECLCLLCKITFISAMNSTMESTLVILATKASTLASIEAFHSSSNLKHYCLNALSLLFKFPTLSCTSATTPTWHQLSLYNHNHNRSKGSMYIVHYQPLLHSWSIYIYSPPKKKVQPIHHDQGPPIPTTNRQ